jgi:hypothetical protein
VVMEERAVPALGDLAPGTYHLAIGLYQVQSGQRVSLLDSDGQPLGDVLDLPIYWTVSN